MLKSYKRLSQYEKKLLSLEIAALNHRVCRLVIPIIAGMEALLIVCALIGRPLSDIGRPFLYITDYLYLWCYLVLFTFCAVLTAIHFFVWKNPANHAREIRAVTIAFSIGICVWSVCVSLLDYYYFGSYNPIVILTVFMGLAGAVFMYPKECIALFAATITLYLTSAYFMAARTNAENPPAIMLLNTAIFLAIAIVISLARFDNRVADFVLKSQLERKNTELSLVNDKLIALNLQLEHISITDRLTQLRNRWAFTTRLKEVFDRCKANRSVMTVVIMDLDDFKMVNDRFGHTVGDECLVDTARILKKHVSCCDLFRYGGEEFVVVFHGISEARAFIIVEEIRKEIESTPLTSCALNITISGGQFSYVPVGNIREDRFVINADRALYHAKQTGKNRIEVYKDVGESDFLGTNH